MKTALITGIAGQDGTYLALLLLEKGYAVHGIASLRKDREYPALTLEALAGVTLHPCDMFDAQAVSGILRQLCPDEIYHLASDVEPRTVDGQELTTFDINFRPGMHILDAAKNRVCAAKVYIAGSSLMFGNTSEKVQTESTPMSPSTPYGIAKVALYHFMRTYRDIHGISACMGILYNHESPIRSERFLPRKISKAVAKIKFGRQKNLILGDIEISRDWSFAGDVVESMWRMLQNDRSEDYVVGSGKLHTISEMLAIAFGVAGLDWREYVVSDPRLLRKIDYPNLCADSTRIRAELGWSPRMCFEDLVKTMVESDLQEEASND